MTNSYASPGTLVLSPTEDGERLQTRGRDLLIHHYVSVSSNCQFDAGRCRTPGRYMILPDEEHILITDLDNISVATANRFENRNVLSINPNEPMLRLVYGIRLKARDMTLNIGKDTPLSMILRSGCLSITPKALTRDELNKMLEGPSREEPEVITLDSDDDEE